MIFALALQAVLLLWNPGLLPVWTDEGYTLETAPLPAGEIVRLVAADVHPPLYLLLAHAWLRLPLPGSDVARLRALSAACALVATLVIYRLWLAKVERGRQWRMLALWCLSPCLLLYGRMARSYALQVLVACLAFHAADRSLKRPGELRPAAAFGATVALLLYTHYVPGLAAGVAFAMVCIWQAARRRTLEPLRDLAVAAGVTIALYAPWMATLAAAVGKWGGRGEVYRAFAKPLVDEAAKFGYCLFSFSFGETPPPVALVAAAVLLPLAAWLALRGAWPEAISATGAFVFVATGVAWVGVSRWVSFPFVPARLLFLLPLYLALIARGSE